MRKGITIMKLEKYDSQNFFQKILEKKISQTLCTSSTIWCKNILQDFLCQIKTQRRHITHVLSHICLSKSTRSSMKCPLYLIQLRVDCPICFTTRSLILSSKSILTRQSKLSLLMCSKFLSRICHTGPAQFIWQVSA